MGTAERRLRPRDATATRERILDCARTQFARLGYRATTVKQVADLAEVSPNLITRYFGGKEGLFLAAAQPAVAVDDVFTGDLAGLGQRLARSILTRWATQTEEDPLLVLLRAAGERPDAATRLAAFLDANTTARLERYLRDRGVDPRDARDRAEAIDALILGTTTRRRVLREDLGDTAELERWLGRAIQVVATG